MTASVPRQMRALLLEQYNENILEAIDSLKVVERPVPPLRRGQVLVKMDAAPCNPSDLLLLQAKYGSLKTLPTVPGWEGTGKVVASGGGMLGAWLKGKRVACGLSDDRDGTWAQYFVANATECLPVDARLPVEQAASLIVNPMSVVGLMETARRGRHRAIVHTAGASQLGRMLVAMAPVCPVINVVRREGQVELLHSLGAKHVLNSSDGDFPRKLHDICHELNATLAFDAVAGPMTGIVLGAMPPGSTVCVYGALSEQACGQIDPIDLIFRGKRIEGFYLGTWLKTCGRLKLFRLARQMQGLLIDGRIETKVQRRASLDEAVDGLKQYIAHMTDGKVLITP